MSSQKDVFSLFSQSTLKKCKSQRGAFKRIQIWLSIIIFNTQTFKLIYSEFNYYILITKNNGITSSPIVCLSFYRSPSSFSKSVVLLLFYVLSFSFQSHFPSNYLTQVFTSTDIGYKFNSRVPFQHISSSIRILPNRKIFGKSCYIN